MTSTKYPTDLTDAQWDKLLPYLPEPSPIVAIISQSVKTTELANSRGFDAHKKVKGRKRHIVTDTIGIPLGVKVTDQCQ